MVGSLITGQMVSRLSRFNILIIFNVMVIMSSILLLIPALIESLPVFAIAKFLIGVACGGFAVICPIYVNETTPKQYLGGAGATFQSVVCFGIFTATATSLGFPAYPKAGLLLDGNNALILLIWTSLIPLIVSVVQIALLLTVYRFDTLKLLKEDG